MKISCLLAAVALLAACATAPRMAPLVDYTSIWSAREHDRALDTGRVGYSFADERKGLTDPDRLTREENDWTSAEVTRNSPRLIGFCSKSRPTERASRGRGSEASYAIGFW